MKKAFGTVLFFILVFALAFPSALPVYAENNWAVGNLVGLCAGTPIHTGSGDSYPVHTYVPEDNWTVKVIDGPRLINGETWWDTSRAAAGDPSGGTGWVKQSEADSCFGGGGGGGGGGETETPPPTKPDIKSRAVWHAIDPMSVEVQAPNHIVVHHTDNDLSDTLAREFKIAFSILKGKDPRFSIFDVLSLRGDGKYQTIRNTWPGLIWLIQADHMLVQGYSDIGYHYLIDPNGVIYEGRQGGSTYKGESVASGNTGVIGVAILGDYQNNKPTSASLESAKSLITWLAYEYRDNNLQVDGEYIIPFSVDGIQSCKFNSEIECTVDDVTGHKYIKAKTSEENTECPGINLDVNLPYLRNQGDKQATSSYPSAQAQTNGKFFGVFSPAVIEVVDPIGNRLGVNSETGQVNQEIIGGTYNSGKLFENEDGSHDSATIAYIPELIEGVYQINVIGTGNGNYTIAVIDAESGIAAKFEGVTEPGKVDNFQMINDTQDPTQFEMFNDNEAPVTSISLSGQTGNNDWFITQVDVSFSAEDMPNSGASGVQYTEYSIDNGTTWQRYEKPFVFTDGSHKIQYRSVDRVNNVEETKQKEIKIDTVAPVVNVYTDQPTYTRVQPFIVHYSGYDPEPGSGLASLTGLFNNQQVVDGQDVDLFWLDLGQYTLSVTGEDYAGWVTTESESIEMIATIESLQQTVSRLCTENYISKEGICKSLQNKLDAAFDAQKHGKAKTVVNILGAFQNAIKAQTDKTVMPEAKYLLIMDSNYVIKQLGVEK